MYSTLRLSAVQATLPSTFGIASGSVAPVARSLKRSVYWRRPTVSSA